MSNQKKHNNRKRLVLILLLLPLVIAVAWNAFLWVNRYTEKRWVELCDNLYSEAYEYQYNGADLKRLRELTDEELDALISDLRKQDTNRIELYKFAYKKYCPYTRWHYDNDTWFDRDEIVSCFEDIRTPLSFLDVAKPMWKSGTSIVLYTLQKNTMFPLVYN